MAGIVISNASKGLPPPPPGYRWNGSGPGAQLVPETQVVTDASGHQQEVPVAPPLMTGRDGSQFDSNGNIIVSYGPDGMPSGGSVYGEQGKVNPNNLQPGQQITAENGQILQGNDRGTADIVDGNGNVIRAGNSAPSWQDENGNWHVASTQAGNPNVITDPFGVAENTGLGFMNNNPLSNGVNAGGRKALEGGSATEIIGAAGKGFVDSPEVQDVAGAAGKAVDAVGGAIGDLFGGLGGGGGGGAVTPAPAANPNAYELMGDPNYAATSGAYSANVGAEGRSALNDLAGYSYDTGNQGAAALADYAPEARGLAAGATDRLYGYGGGAVDYGTGAGNMLFGLEQDQGPSGAEALLQQGANRSMAQSLALARSGRGYGSSALGLQQALQSNAGTMQDVGNAAALLKAQEYAAWKQRQAANISAGGALGLNAYTTGINAANAGGQLGLTGVDLGMKSTQSAVNTALAGASQAGGLVSTGTNDALAGQAQSDAIAKAQADARAKAEAEATARYGIESTERTGARNAAAVEKGALIGAGATAASGLLNWF